MSNIIPFRPRRVCAIDGMEIPVCTPEELVREARLEDQINQWRRQFQPIALMDEVVAGLRPGVS